MLQGILFDLGDTLFDTEPVNTRSMAHESARAIHDLLSSRGHKLPPLGRYFRMQYRAVRWHYLWSKLRRREFNSFELLKSQCRRMNLSLDEATLREIAWMWYAPVTEHTTVAADVVPTLRLLRDRGLKLGMVSNTFIPGFVLDRHLALLGLLEFLPVRIYSSEVGYRKPHPRIFQLALEALGISPARAAFVGDIVKTDIVGARCLGMVTILRQPFANSRTHHVADHVIRNMTDLCQILPILGASAGQRAETGCKKVPPVPSPAESS